MIAGSAASLRRRAPEMSPSQFYSFPQPLADPMPGSASPRSPVQALAASDPPRGRILLIEAQAVIALDLQRELREAGYRAVGPATSVAEVRALLAKRRIDAAVLDLDGLGKTGAEIADALAQADVPFVFLASGSDVVPARHSERGIVDKPYSKNELLRALETAMAPDEPGIIYPVVSGPVSWPRVLPQL